MILLKTKVSNKERLNEQPVLELEHSDVGADSGSPTQISSEQRKEIRHMFLRPHCNWGALRKEYVYGRLE